VVVVVRHSHVWIIRRVNFESNKTAKKYFCAKHMIMRQDICDPEDSNNSIKWSRCAPRTEKHKSYGLLSTTIQVVVQRNWRCVEYLHPLT
jgi:hypothetical protein